MIDLLHTVFRAVMAMNPSKNANAYWQAVNRSMLDYGESVAELWRTEKIATLESINISKKIALDHYASERDAIMRLTHDEALKKSIEMHRIDSRVDTIKAMTDNSLMNVT